MDKKVELSDINYIKRVSIGSINPNNVLSDDAIDIQMQYLNRCLRDIPRGRIIGKDVAIGRYQLGEHELCMERTTYHVGFARRPDWIED